MTKQLRYLCTLLLCMIASVGWVKADTTYSLTPNNEKTGSNATSYITTLTEFTYAGVSWKMNQWNPSTLQVKTNQGYAASEFRFYNTSAFPGKIKQVVIKFSALTLSNTSITGFMFVGGTSEVTATTGGTNGTWDSNKKTITWTPNATDNYTYFAFYQNGKVATGTNKLAVEDAIVVTYETSGGNGTENNPYSVAQALANAPSTGTSDYVYVKGIVSKFYADDIMSDGTNYRYYISDDGATNNQLLVYQGKKSNTDAFSSVDDLRTGDLVVIYGQLKKYSSVTEFEPGNYIVSLKRELANANLSFSETSYTTTLGEDFTAPTLTNPYGLPVSYASSNEDVATVANDGTVTLVGVGETTITASSEATSTYAAGSASYTLTVEAAPTQLVTVDEKGNITFDLSDNGWGFATSSTNAGTSEATFSNNGYDIKVYAPNAYYYYSEGNALLMGKSGAYLILPEFDFDVSRIEVTGSSKAGTNVKQNIFVGDNAVSTETTGAKDITNIYDISGNYQKAGNIYVLKVTSAHNTQISSIKVIKKIAAAVETPTFNVATGTYFEAQSVEISCATDGTTIHYTTDGTDPTATSTEYTEPISISATTTLKAIAVKGEATSAVASATYTFGPIYTKFDDANKAATSDGAKVRIKTDAYVVYKNGSYTYLRDGNRFGLLIYGNNELEVGSRLVNAVIEGTLYTYNGLPEVKDYSINQSSTEYGYRTNVRVVDAATLKANPLDYVSQYVMVLPAEFDSDFNANTSSSGSATNATFKVGETELVVRDNFKLGCSAEAEKEYSVAGFVNIYNSTIQLYPTSTNDILEINDDYTFVKVTDKKQLAPGNEFVVLSSDNYYGSGDTRYFVLGNGENLDGIGYKRIAGVVVRRNQDNTALIGEDAMVLTLGGTEGAYSFRSDKGYLTCVSEENVVSGNTSTVNVIKYADNEDKTLKISDDFQVLRDGSKLQMIPYTTDEFTWANNYNSAYLYVKKNHKLLPAAPTFSPAAGEVEKGTEVTISAEEGATLKYTVGETTTTTESNTATVTVNEDVTIKAVAVKDGVESEEVSAAYTVKAEEPVEEPGTPVEITEGFYTIKNNGNEKYVNVAGRRTVTFVDEATTATAPGTVIKVSSNADGQVQILRSQGVDIPGYAQKAMNYVPEIVQLVVEKLNNLDPDQQIMGENGMQALLNAFNEGFDYHLYTEQAEGGIRIYGKTPSMEKVVKFYEANTANVDAKLPMLESLINKAIDKVLEKTGGSGASILKHFSLAEIWTLMGSPSDIAQPTEDTETQKAFLQWVLRDKTRVWNFAYQTAMIYWKPLINHDKVQQNLSQLGDLAQYVTKIENIQPESKYYIVQNEGKLDVFNVSNIMITEDDARTIWTLSEPRTEFKVNFNEENTLNGKYYTTLYTDFAYTLPEGVKAMTVTKVSELNGKSIAITEAIEGAVPAQTPVLLESESADAQTLTLSIEDGAAPTDNLLKGPDYLINEYGIKTAQVQDLFLMVKDILGETFYQNYIEKYEHLTARNAGTVNNKYFFGLDDADIELCTYDSGNSCVVRNLSTGDEELGFYDNWTVDANKAFLVSETNPVKLWLKGDVDRDGDVDYDDVKALVKIVLGEVTEGNNPNNYDFDAAKVNEDTEINIADVTALVNILK